ncbi:hypothetical protein [Hufsiella ginkgonis]|uniref:Uncharacterized protein n=1 Tax=Hufsiella ginkgonis TaxID=2695274 RepID=A0A7K1XU41_9SPHI|nr:hypothetical protein [Hufsiella ginkgonis]MXV14533.1 hypothetical protein [Hufsiella ginkgonis]
MKSLFATLAALPLFIVSARSQETPSTPSMAVIIKVQDISSVVNLSETRKAALTAYFQKEEAAISSAMANPTTTTQQMEALKRQLRSEFRELLSTQELTSYSLKKRGSPYAIIDTAAHNNGIR